MTKNAGNWDDKRPGMAERLSTCFAIHSGISDTLGGLPESTVADFDAAVGMLPSKLDQAVLGAGCGAWPGEWEVLREMVLRRSWHAWQDNGCTGNMNAPLNMRITDMVLDDWILSPQQRNRKSDAKRCHALKVDTRRYKNQLEKHCLYLLNWLDAVTRDALKQVQKQLRRV